MSADEGEGGPPCEEDGGGGRAGGGGAFGVSGRDGGSDWSLSLMGVWKPRGEAGLWGVWYPRLCSSESPLTSGTCSDWPGCVSSSSSSSSSLSSSSDCVELRNAQIIGKFLDFAKNFIQITSYKSYRIS